MAKPDLKLEEVPLRVTEPTRIPARRYYDEEFFRLERDRLWPRVWQMACRLEEIPEIGDWIEYKVLDKSVIVVRTGTGIRAYHNACRHRGVRLADTHGNCAANGFVCPFHGWRWNMDGENTFVFGRSKFAEADLDPADIALAPCRVELWGGCAFVNFDDEAPPLRDCLGSGAERVDARGVDDLRIEWWKSSVLPVNWKLAMEAFMEGYHVMATHPQLHAVTAPEMRAYGKDHPQDTTPPASASAREWVQVSIDHLAKLSEGMAGMVLPREVAIARTLHDMELPDEVGPAMMAFYSLLREKITDQGRAEGMPVPDLNQLAQDYPFNAVEYFFPNYFLLPMFSAMVGYRIRPLEAESCLFEIFSLAFVPPTEAREPPSAPVPTRHDDPSYPEIPRQDYSNLPRQQLGLHAQGFEFMRLAPEMEGLISNYQRLIDGYLAGMDRDVLAAGASRASGGYDSPLIDIGF
jgi:nitrite reductase/ring-hydroxylating ferredoxin subunit